VVLSLAWALSSAAPGAGERSRIPDCPATPNCVSSGSRADGHYIRPLAFEGDPDGAWQRLKRALALEPGLALVEENPAERLLRGQAPSRVFRFVDDVELRLLPDAKVIELRSASRAGYWDFGVNRRRMERLRQRFEGFGEQR
jgi:uncharacterized protein (DUF1499 family)